MGIPFYFMSLIKAHTGIVKPLRKSEPLKVDILCIDFNCLIHKYLKDQEPIQSVLDGLKMIMEDICHSTKILIAFDGLVPYGKIVQQRYRRMRNKSQEEQGSFDRNQISPDTPYMKKLELELSKQFPNIQISPTQKSGEGEHKIFKELRKEKTKIKSICIYGLDADLILLSLYHHSLASEEMYLLRESIEMHSSEEFSVLNCKSLSKVLPIDINQYLVLCIMCFGNDFMPNLALFSLRDGGYDRALQIYEKCGNPNLLDEEGRFKFLEESAKYEMEFLRTRRNNPYEKQIIGKDLKTIQKKYYLHNLDGIKNIDNVVLAYWKTFHWTLDYFINNKPINWNWVYPYCDAPLIENIIECYEVQCEKAPLKFTITDQLRFILPIKSLKEAKRKPIFKDEIYDESRPLWIKKHDWEMKPLISLPWNPIFSLTSISLL